MLLAPLQLTSAGVSGFNPAEVSCSSSTNTRPTNTTLVGRRTHTELCDRVKASTLQLQTNIGNRHPGGLPGLHCLEIRLLLFWEYNMTMMRLTWNPSDVSDGGGDDDDG